VKGFLRLVGTVALLVVAAYGLRAYFQRSDRTADGVAPVFQPAAGEGTAGPPESGSASGRLPVSARVFTPSPAEAGPPPAPSNPAREVDALDALAQGKAKLAAAREPSQFVEAWRLLSVAYNEAPDAALRNEARDLLRPFIEREVLSQRLPDDSGIAQVWMVKQGDTLGKIAKQCGTTVEAIKRLNGLTSDLIQAGRRLKVLDRPLDVYVDKSDFRLWVLYGGSFLLELPCGLGLQNKTPVARFEIENRQIKPPWYSDEGVILPHDPRYELGERWLGFKDSEAGTGLGIHGTADPTSIGKESSRGCIRLLNPDVILLYDLLPTGTRVRVLP